MYFVYIHLFAYLCVYACVDLHVFIGAHNTHAYIHAQTLIYTCSMCVCMRTYVCMFAYVFICMCNGQNLTLIKMMTCVLPAISATPSHPRASHHPKDISVRESPFGDLYSSKPYHIKVFPIPKVPALNLKL